MARDPHKDLFAVLNFENLNNQTKQSITQLLEKGDRNELKIIINELNTKDPAIQTRVEKTIYKNITTLIVQACKYNPGNVNTENLKWLDKGSDFFLEKIITVSDSSRSFFYIGRITKCKKQSDIFDLLMEDGREIKIYPNKIIFKEKFEYKLWTAITEIFDTQEEFKIRANNEFYGPNAIKDGTYRVKSKKYVKSMLIGDNEHIEVELVSIGTEICKNIRGYYQHNNSDDLMQKKITKITIDKSHDYTYHSFNRKYECVKFKETTLNGINESNIYQCITIKEEVDENKKKIRILKEINEELNKIQTKLISQPNLLNELLESLVKSKLESVNIKILKTQPELYEHLKSISQRYKKDLDRTEPPEHILKQLVEEANYSTLIQKEKSVLVARTMSLLKDAYQHIDNMKGKELILFLGNTGSGKSVAVNYFLGIPLKSFRNSVGDSVVEVETSPQNSSCPKIGQSLGQSETLYAQCYRLSETPQVMLVDCPGFNDTRGSDYELCTNLSIDEAVNQAGTIKSIVVVVPVSAFLTDRANSFIELINTIEERFPRIFDGLNPSTYLLITKQQQFQPESVEGIKDGRRFNEFVIEAKRRLEQIQVTTNGQLNKLEIENAIKRQNLWQTVLGMWQNKRIHFIDIEDTLEGQDTLALYTKSQEINKKRYVPSMQGPQMQRTFGKHVQMFTHTWNKFIFKQYLKELPEFINNLEKDIEKKKTELNKLNAQKNDTTIKLREIIEKRESINDLCKRLEEVQKDNSKVTPDLQKLLSQEIKKKKDSRLSDLQTTLNEVKEIIEKKQISLQQIEANIEQIKNQIDDCERKKNERDNEIEELSRGTTKESIWSLKYGPDDDLSYVILKDNAVRETAFNELRHYNQEEIKERITVKAKDFRGTLQHTALISRDYKLVPIDPEQRKNFDSCGSSGLYTAHIVGKNFELDLGRKSCPTGKKIAYGFQTTWKSDQSNNEFIIPWIEVYHDIPNIDKNEATIINKNAEITQLQRIIAQNREELNYKESAKKLLLSSISTETEKKSILEEVKENLTKTIESEQIEQMIDACKNDILNCDKQKKGLEGSLKNINEEIENMNDSIKKIDNNLNQQRITKRNLAIIIKIETNGGVAKLLYNFANLVVGKNNVESISEIREDNHVIMECIDFIENYTKIETLKKQCSIELGF